MPRSRPQLDRVRHLSLADKGWPKMIDRQHVEIVGAIRDKDPIGAEQAMQAHLRTVFDAVKRIAHEHAQFFERSRRRSTGGLPDGTDMALVRP